MVELTLVAYSPFFPPQASTLGLPGIFGCIGCTLEFEKGCAKEALQKKQKLHTIQTTTCDSVGRVPTTLWYVLWHSFCVLLHKHPDAIQS